MCKTVNIVKKMRTTNCKISIFCSVSSIFTLFRMCVKFISICLLKKKLLLCIFTTKVGYVSIAMYVCSLNVFCQGPIPGECPTEELTVLETLTVLLRSEEKESPLPPQHPHSPFAAPFPFAPGLFIPPFP